MQLLSRPAAIIKTLEAARILRQPLLLSPPNFHAFLFGYSGFHLDENLDMVIFVMHKCFKASLFDFIHLYFPRDHRLGFQIPCVEQCQLHHLWQRNIDLPDAMASITS